LIGAVITAAVAVVVAVLNQFEINRRERNARTADRRRRALEDLQDAALRLRGALRDYGAAVRTAAATTPPGELSSSDTTFDARVDPETTKSRDDAAGALVVYAVRIEDQGVVDALEAWRASASVRFLSVQEITASEEEASWQRLHAAIGNALTPRPSRQRQTRQIQAIQAAKAASPRRRGGGTRPRRGGRA
jgi:hypothetical protein